MEKYLVTSALPYANGRLHIGHVAGAYLPADIFVRFQKLIGNEALYICGTDEHGTPVALKAEAEGTTPQAIVQRYHDSIKASFEGLNFCFDNFSGTSRPQHRELSQKFFLNLYERGYITQHTIKQHFCPVENIFLADRYVEGVCPHCGAAGARGDQCDACGKLIDAITLANPACKLCGAAPEVRETTHWYIDLPKFEPDLRAWLETKSAWKDNVLNFILSWLDQGLKERSITRDISWGVPVPLPDAEGKVLYVWFDAPIGYISSTIEWAEQRGEPDSWKDYWLDPQTKLVHFIGKDNIPFHTIIWPAVLMKQDDDYILPHDVPANEYLNLEGQKISTSRDWAIWVEEYLKYFDGDLLRYVLAVNAPETRDSDFSWSDFQARVNSELANVLGNLANRVFAFAAKFFDSGISRPDQLDAEAQTTLDTATAICNEVRLSYQGYRVRRAVGLIMDIARLGNKYFDETAPWKSVKTEPELAGQTLYVCAELLRIISIVFNPVLPHKMQVLRNMLSMVSAVSWERIHEPCTHYQIQDVEPLFPKIDDAAIEEQTRLLIEQSKVAVERRKAAEEAVREKAAAQACKDELAAQAHKDESAEQTQFKAEIEYDDFARLDLRVVEVLTAERVQKSKKLLRLEVKCGAEQRQVVAGLAKHYTPEQLIGRKVLMLANLKPRKLMGLESQGMILAAEDDSGLAVLLPERDVPDGSSVE